MGRSGLMEAPTSRAAVEPTTILGSELAWCLNNLPQRYEAARFALDVARVVDGKTTQDALWATSIEQRVPPALRRLLHVPGVLLRSVRTRGFLTKQHRDLLAQRAVLQLARAQSRRRRRESYGN